MLARWPALFAIVVPALAQIYRFGPDREHAQWHWITWGSGLAALLWVVASILFSWYAANFGSYNKTYGSLGGERRQGACLTENCRSPCRQMSLASQFESANSVGAD